MFKCWWERPYREEEDEGTAERGQWIKVVPVTTGEGETESEWKGWPHAVGCLLYYNRSGEVGDQLDQQVWYMTMHLSTTYLSLSLGRRLGAGQGGIWREWRTFDIVSAEGGRAEVTRDTAGWQGSMATLLRLVVWTCEAPFGPPLWFPPAELSCLLWCRLTWRNC